MANIRRIRCAVTGAFWNESEEGWYVVRRQRLRGKRHFCVDDFEGQILHTDWLVVSNILLVQDLLGKWAAERELREKERGEQGPQ